MQWFVSRVSISSICKQTADNAKAIIASDLLHKDRDAFESLRLERRFTNGLAFRDGKSPEMNGTVFDHAVYSLNRNSLRDTDTSFDDLHVGVTFNLARMIRAKMITRGITGHLIVSRKEKSIFSIQSPS